MGTTSEIYSRQAFKEIKASEGSRVLDAELRIDSRGREVYVMLLHNEASETFFVATTAAGAAARRLTDFRSGHIETFDWSPDGARLAWITRSRVSDVVLMALPGRVPSS